SALLRPHNLAVLEHQHYKPVAMESQGRPRLMNRPIWETSSDQRTMLRSACLVVTTRCEVTLPQSFEYGRVDHQNKRRPALNLRPIPSLLRASLVALCGLFLVG